MSETVLYVIRAFALWALAIMFIGMGINHFRRGPARVMAKMIPPRLRSEGRLRPIVLVYFTGVCEIAGGLGLMFPPTRPVASVALIVLLIAVFPANVYASRHRETFGRAAIPLWPRLAGQAVLIALLALVAGY